MLGLVLRSTGFQGFSQLFRRLQREKFSSLYKSECVFVKEREALTVTSLKSIY